MATELILHPHPNRVINRKVGRQLVKNGNNFRFDYYVSLLRQGEELWVTLRKSSMLGDVVTQASDPAMFAAILERRTVGRYALILFYALPKKSEAGK